MSGDGEPWTVQFDVKNLGGHLDLQRGARVGILSGRSRMLRMEYAVVGVLLLGFRGSPFFPTLLFIVMATVLCICSLPLLLTLGLLRMEKSGVGFGLPSLL